MAEDMVITDSPRRIMGWQSKPPKRKEILQMRHEDPQRHEIIIKRANWVMGGLQENEKFQRTRMLTDLEEYVASESQSYVYYDALSVSQTFLNIKEQWDHSQDARDLQDTVEMLIHQGRLANVNKVICFGLGPLIGTTEYCAMKKEPHGLKAAARNSSQHAAAMTIARELNEQLSEEQRIRLIAQDPDYRQQDVTMLRRLRFEVLNGEYGLHEALLEVDKNTLIVAIGIGLGLQQVICETARPAAMVWTWTGPETLKEWKGLRAAGHILSSEYDMIPCAALEEEWKSGREAEIVPEAGAPYFGEPKPNGLSILKRKSHSGVLRRARFLNEATFYVRKARYSA
ncbi:hypothetical protein F4810DRAFT_715688 [Camillea tinctor]|nr:hypothetical protein F4810DRAFT_715688 [Camillea tinctor]